MKTQNEKNTDTLKDEYDFTNMTGGVKGKYVNEYNEGVNLVLLDPDVAKIFLHNLHYLFMEFPTNSY